MSASRWGYGLMQASVAIELTAEDRRALEWLAGVVRSGGYLRRGLR